MPSSVEALPLAMLEAMACGTPTVATDVGGAGDALRGAGIVIDPTVLAEQLPLAISTLLELPSVGAELGRLARERVVARFSLEDKLDALVELYREVA